MAGPDMCKGHEKSYVTLWSQGSDAIVSAGLLCVKHLYVLSASVLVSNGLGRLFLGKVG